MRRKTQCTVRQWTKFLEMIFHLSVSLLWIFLRTSLIQFQVKKTLEISVISINVQSYQKYLYLSFHYFKNLTQEPHISSQHQKKICSNENELQYKAEINTCQIFCSNRVKRAIFLFSQSRLFAISFSAIPKINWTTWLSTSVVIKCFFKNARWKKNNSIFASYCK